jgi:hypothetical protein
MTGDDHRLDRGIRQHFLDIADAADLAAQAVLHLLAERGRVRKDAMTPAFRQGAGHVNTVGMISQESETHESIRSAILFRREVIYRFARNDKSPRGETKLY